MKKTLTSLLLGGILTFLGSGCSMSQKEQPKIEQNSLSWEQEIEREIRKVDFWVEEEVEQDYTNDKKEGHVSLKNISLVGIENTGLLKFAAAYNPTTDILLLAEFRDVESKSRTLEAVDHELWHALYDKEGNKGILHSPKYKGPNLEEIASYCTEKVSGKEFQDLREKLKIAEESQRVKLSISQLETRLNKIKSSTDILLEMQKYLQDNKELDTYILKEDKEKINAEKKEIMEKSTQFRRTLENVVQHVDEWKTIIKDRIIESREVTLEHLVKNREQFDKYASELAQYSDIHKIIVEWKMTVKKAYNAAEIRKADKEIEEVKEKLKSAKDEKEIEVLKDIIQFYELIKDSIKHQIETEETLDLLKDTSSGISSFKSLLISTSNIYAIDQILNNPDEVMARVVHSLYALYFGETTDNKFSLNEDDLKFLDRFTYKGKRLFHKGIERYHLGREMIKEGISPEEVKQKLEYATSVSHKGNQYSLPEANFHIKGKIPTINFFKKEK